MVSIRHVQVIRYVTPLREGGSLPAIVECDDGFLYVLKFRGAGQGKKALIAELIGSEVARALGFQVPEVIFADLDEAFGRIEGDEEIQDLLKASTGLNLGLHYLSGAITYDPVASPVSPEFAARVVWLDAFLMNVDRTYRNTNMLLWKKEIWLIDHGASLYFHHQWSNTDNARKPFPMIRDHVFLSVAAHPETCTDEFRSRLTAERITSITNAIPEAWLDDPHFSSPEENRNAYRNFLGSRLEQADFFTNEINHARKTLV